MGIKPISKQLKGWSLASRPGNSKLFYLWKQIKKPRYLRNSFDTYLL